MIDLHLPPFLLAGRKGCHLSSVQFHKSKCIFCCQADSLSLILHVLSVVAGTAFHPVICRIRVSMGFVSNKSRKSDFRLSTGSRAATGIRLPKNLLHLPPPPAGKCSSRVLSTAFPRYLPLQRQPHACPRQSTVRGWNSSRVGI